VAGVEFAHAFTFLRTLGGVQGLLRRHRAEDERWGLSSRVIAWFERDDPADPRVSGLGLSGRDSIHTARARLAAVAAGLPAPLVVGYYNLWGLPFFAGVDGASRRIGVLHSDWPDLAERLRRVRPLVDGALCVSRPLVDAARRAWPEMADERIAFLPCPVDPPAALLPRPPLEGRPLVIGYCGRLSRVQKRVDRLPELVSRLRGADPDFRLELLGDGRDEAWLRRRLGSEPRVVFRGRLGGEAYWRTLNGWDAIVFTSDYEGLPLALLEAMGVGAVPVYPRIGCGGADCAGRVAPELLYEPGDMAACAAAVRRLARLPAAELDAARGRSVREVAPHLGDAYFRTFSEFVRRIAALPRISAPPSTARRFRPADRLPLGVLRRFHHRALWRGDAD
jgi:glycosyltransferase involved in cell wall biosynthesis